MLRINDVYPTLQGEGALAGVPMLLLRLHGCGVGCPWCDTKETWDVRTEDYVETLDDLRVRQAGRRRCGEAPRAWWTQVDENALVGALRAIKDAECPAAQYVLITGGEPLEQNIERLLVALRQAGFLVALETSGTRKLQSRLSPMIDHICVSPKFGMNRETHVKVAQLAHELKFIIGRQADIDAARQFREDVRRSLNGSKPTYESRDRHGPAARVYLQPVSQSQKATELCINTILTDEDFQWQISVQTHKYLRIP